MIVDQLVHRHQYRPLGSLFERAFAWFDHFREDFPDGRYDIEGGRLYALVQSYVTVRAEEKKYEAHRLYADIQYLFAGGETIRWAPIGTLAPATEYNEDQDYQLYGDPADEVALPLRAGRFALFFPHDAHKPGGVLGAPAPIRKVVIKVRL